MEQVLKIKKEILIKIKAKDNVKIKIIMNITFIMLSL